MSISSGDRFEKQLCPNWNFLAMRSKEISLASLVKDELETLAARQEKHPVQLAGRATRARPLPHPALAARYRAEVGNLRFSLKDEARSGEATELLRELVEKTMEEPGGPSINLHGDMTAILQIASQDPRA